MTVPPGFRVEVVAAEPDIVNPVAMTFDERGRIWITESLEYPRRRPGPGRDRVKVLEDTDGDGKADRFTVFADGLNIPSGIAVGHGGVWVANSPDILFLQRHRRRRQGRHARGRRDRLRPQRHPRAAQLADLGPRRLALRLERRFQPQQGRLEERQDVRVHLRDLPDPPQDPRLRGLVRGDEQPLGHRHRSRRLVLLERLRDRPPLAPGRDRLLHPPGRAVSAVHLADRVDRRPHATRRRPIAASTTSTARPIRPSIAAGSTWATSTATASTSMSSSGTARPIAPRPRPISCGPTTPGSCRSSQKTGPDGCLYILDWYDRYHCYQDANRDPGGHRPAQGAALPRALQGDAAPGRLRPGQGER